MGGWEEGCGLTRHFSPGKSDFDCAISSFFSFFFFSLFGNHARTYFLLTLSYFKAEKLCENPVGGGGWLVGLSWFRSRCYHVDQIFSCCVVMERAYLAGYSCPVLGFAKDWLLLRIGREKEKMEEKKKREVGRRVG